eukprot:5419542-Pleurochrysis_carterae.AAC.2
MAHHVVPTPHFAAPAAGLPLCCSHSPSNTCLVAATPPPRRIAPITRFIAIDVSLSASPPPLTSSYVAARAMPANALPLPSAEA